MLFLNWLVTVWWALAAIVWIYRLGKPQKMYTENERISNTIEAFILTGLTLWAVWS